jgi:hypothetical protein
MADMRLQMIIAAQNRAQKELDEAKKQIQELTDKLDEVGKSSKKAGNDLKEAGIVFGAVAAAGTLAMKSWVNASLEQERAVQRLETLVLNVSGATDEHVKALKAQAAAMQKTTTIGDEAVMMGQSQLATFQLSADAIQTLIPAMGDLAVAVNGVNVNQDQMVQTANLMGKAMDGNVGALSRVGVSFTDAQEKVLKTGNEMQRAATMAEVLKMNFGGLAVAMRDTTEGSIAKMHQQIGELQESLGDVLAPIVGKVAEAVAGMAQRFNELSPGVKEAIVYVTAAVTVFAAVAAAIIGIVLALPALTAAWLALGAGLTAIGGTLASIMAAFIALNPVTLALAGALAIVAGAWYMVDAAQKQVIASIQETITWQEQQAAKYQELANISVGAEKQKAQQQADIAKAAAEVQRTLSEEYKAQEEVRYMAGKFWMSASEKEARETALARATEAKKAAQAEFDAVAKAGRDGALERKRNNEVIRVSTITLANALQKVGQQEFTNRMNLVKSMGISEVKIQQAVFEAKGQIGKKEIEQIVKQFNEQAAYAADLKNKLTATFSSPIIQKVKIGVEAIGLGEAVGGALEKAQAFLQSKVADFAAQQKPIETDFSAHIENMPGGGGGGGKDAAEEMKKKQEEIQQKIGDARQAYRDLVTEAQDALLALDEAHKKSTDSITANIDKLKASLTDLTDTYNKTMAGLDVSLAEKVVAQEEKISALQKQIKDEQAKEGGGDTGRTADLQAQLDKEQQALAQFNANSKGLEDELTEARRRAGITDFERYVEDINKRKEQEGLDYEDKKTKIEAEILLLQDQQTREQVIYDAKRAEIQLTMDKMDAFKTNVLDNMDAMSEGITTKSKIMEAQLKSLQNVLKETIAIEETLAQKRAARGEASGGGKQGGGAVMEGMAYTVGEKGQELFVPGAQGRIYPNDALGKKEINVNVTVSGNTIASDIDVESIGARIAQMLTRTLQLRQLGSS